MEFTMSQYMNAEELYKAKSEYYQDLSDELQQEINELKAYIERLRAAFNENKWIDDRDFAVMNVLHETPPQSLNKIKAQVEDETIKEYTEYLKCDGYEIWPANVEGYSRKYK